MIKYFAVKILSQIDLYSLNRAKPIEFKQMTKNGSEARAKRKTKQRYISY